MKRFVALSTLVATFIVGAVTQAREPEADAAKAKKFHVYTVGCRLGSRLVLSTDDPNEVRKALDGKELAGQEVRVVSGPHTRADVTVKTPVRYDVYGDGPRRCGNMRSLGVTTSAPNYDEFAKKLLHPVFTAVSFQ